MAQTDVNSLGNMSLKAMCAIVNDEKLPLSFWLNGDHNFVGRDLNDFTMPIHMVNEFSENNGTLTATYGLVNALTGEGVTGDNVLEGNEEALQATTQTIQIDQHRHAVTNKGRLDDQVSVVKLREKARPALSLWQAQTLDTLMFQVMFGVPLTTNLDGSARPSNHKWLNFTFASDISAPTANRKMFISDRASTAAITPTDTMSWEFILSMQAHAKRMGLPGIIEGGKENYLVVMSTEQLRDLNRDPTFLDIVKTAHKQGPDNPLFKGSAVSINGLHIYDHTKVPTTLGLATGAKWGSGGDVDGAMCALVGRQAVAFADIEEQRTYVEQKTDYDNQIAAAIGSIIGFKKSKFYSTITGTVEDFGVMVGYTAAAKTV